MQYSFFPYLSLNFVTIFWDDNPSEKYAIIPLFVIFDKFIYTGIISLVSKLYS